MGIETGLTDLFRRRKKIVSKELVKEAEFEVRYVYSLEGIGLVVHGLLQKGAIEEGVNCLLEGKTGVVEKILSRSSRVKSAFGGQECSLKLGAFREEELKEGQILRFKE